MIPEEGVHHEACDGEPMECRHSPITSGLSAGMFVCPVAEGLQSPRECNTGLALKQVAMLPGIGSSAMLSLLNTRRKEGRNNAKVIVTFSLLSPPSLVFISVAGL